MCSSEELGRLETRFEELLDDGNFDAKVVEVLAGFLTVLRENIMVLAEHSRACADFKRRLSIIETNGAPRRW